MRKIKVLFLDFDDVLNTSETLERGELFESANVEALNAILDNNDVSIVVTSMWRIGATCQELERILVEAGVHAADRVIGVTPCLENCQRGAEIRAWLKQAPEPVMGFVIIDDRSDMETCRRHLVRTDPRFGLVHSQIDEVVDRLAIDIGNTQI